MRANLGTLSQRMTAQQKIRAREIVLQRRKQREERKANMITSSGRRTRERILQIQQIREARNRGKRPVIVSPTHAPMPHRATRSARVFRPTAAVQGGQDAFCKTALGFGDNFHQRSILRVLAQRYRTLYLQTTCPAIYWDIPNVKFIDPGRIPLRTQAKHIAGLPKETFSALPAGTPPLPWRYTPMPNQNRGISHMPKQIRSAGIPLDKFNFYFPVKPEWIAAAEAVKAKLNLNGKQLCLVRAPTLRQEWMNVERSPKIEYLQLLIDRYKDTYFYLGFADLKPGAEDPDGELHGIDVEFYHGELSMTTLFGLIKISDMLISGPGLPPIVAIAERAKCFVVMGGSSSPECNYDACMGLMNFSYAAREPFDLWKKDIPEARIIERFEELRLRPLDKSHEELTESLFIRGTAGFGDNLGLRLVVRYLAKRHKAIYLKTTIPELYWDIPNVKFVFPVDGGFYGGRSWARHIARLPRSIFVDPPVGIKETRRHYGLIYSDEGRRGVMCFDVDDNGTPHQVNPPAKPLNIFEDIRQAVGIPREEFDFSFPVKSEWIAAARDAVAPLDLKGKKLCVIIPPTIRKDWESTSRNPRLEYFQLLIDRYGDEYFFLSVADLEAGQEWLIGELCGVDAQYHHAELSISTLFGLLKIADMVITPPNFGILFGIATRAKAFCIFGGCAGPGVMCDAAMGLDNFGYVAPEPFCQCWQRWHDCNKEIPEERIIGAFEELRQRPLRLFP